jgi:hypothetical protein
MKWESWVLSVGGAKYVGSERMLTDACIEVSIPTGETTMGVRIFKGDTFECDDTLLGKKLGTWSVDLALRKYPFFADNHEDAIRQGCGIVRKILAEFLSNFANAESFPLHWEYGGTPVNLKSLDKDTNCSLRN